MASVVPEADLWGCSLRVSLAPKPDINRRRATRPLAQMSCSGLSVSDWSLWLCSRCRRSLADLEDRHPNCLLNTRLADTEQARTVGGIRAHAGLEHAANLVDPQRIVIELHPICREHVDGFVLPNRHFAAIIAQRRDPTEHKERQVGRPSRDDEAADLYFLAVVRFDRLRDPGIGPYRIH